MGSHDVIAQLRQDITTAENAGDDAAAERLRDELTFAVEADEQDRELPDLSGSGSAPQPPRTGESASTRTPEDLGPGSWEQEEGIATDVPGTVPGAVQEPPD